MFLKRKQQTAQEFISGCLFLQVPLFQNFWPLSKDNPGDNSGTTRLFVQVPMPAARPAPSSKPRRRPSAHMHSGTASACRSRKKEGFPQRRPKPRTLQRLGMKERRRKRPCLGGKKCLGLHVVRFRSLKHQRSKWKQARTAAPPLLPRNPATTTKCQGPAVLTA